MEDAGTDDTIMERFAQMVKDTRGIRLENAVKFLGVDEKTVNKVAAILNQHEIIKVEYTIVGETMFKPGPNIDKRVAESPEIEQSVEETQAAALEPGEIKESTKKETSADKTEKVDRVIDEIRDLIRQKKLKKSTGK